MSRNKGKRYDGNPKLNKKKVFATIIAIIVLIMIVFSLKKILFSNEKTKDVSSLITYFTYFDNNKWGVIDNKGNIIVDAQYDEMVIIPDSNDDIFICSYNIDFNNNTYNTKVLDDKGDEILTDYSLVKPIENTDGKNVWFEKNILTYEENNKVGIIDFKGKKITEAIYDKVFAMPGCENCIIIEKDGKQGLINSNTEEIVIDPQYISIKLLSDTYENGFIVKNTDNLSGVIAVDKNKILDLKYTEVKQVYANNMYVVVENGKLELVDQNGKVILDKGFDSIENIVLDKMIIIKSGKFGVIDVKGNTIIEPKYEDIKFSSTDKYIVQKDGNYGIIDENENTLVEFNYDNISYIKNADFYEAEKSNFKTDIIDRNLKIVLSDIIVSELNVEEGFLRIRKDSEYKYYNFKFEEKENKEVLLTNTLFLVKENGKYGYVNKNGEKIVDCKYDDAKEQNSFGYCAVKKDGKWGALKSDGTVVIEPSKDLDGYLYVDFIDKYYRVDDLSIIAYEK